MPELFWMTAVMTPLERVAVVLVLVRVTLSPMPGLPPPGSLARAGQVAMNSRMAVARTRWSRSLRRVLI